MNKKVFISMLVLSIVFLVGMYVLKIFFPQEFVLAIENERIIAIGNFIDDHLWLRYLCGGITSFVTYWLYCCAVSHRLYLRIKECIMILIVVIIVRVLTFYDVNLSNIISWTSFAFLPALMNGNIKTIAIVFTTHSIAQCLSIGIRNLPMYLTSMNYVTVLFMTLESYFWLLLFYIVFNYKKEKTL